jgi:hypothetical protein
MLGLLYLSTPVSAMLSLEISPLHGIENNSPTSFVLVYNIKLSLFALSAFDPSHAIALVGRL